MPDDHVDLSHRFLRGHCRGDLQFDQHLHSIKYVNAPDGRLVAPVMVAMLQAPETVLFIPEATLEPQHMLQLLVTLIQFDEHGPDGALADRWRIYHGEPPDVQWALLDIDAAKFRGDVIDGDTLMRPNSLVDAEPKVCRHFNLQPDLLRTLALHHAHLEIGQPVMVGLDPEGIDVRGLFDVVRVRADRPMQDADDAIAHLTELHRRLEHEPHPAQAGPERAPSSEPEA